MTLVPTRLWGPTYYPVFLPDVRPVPGGIAPYIETPPAAVNTFGDAAPRLDLNSAQRLNAALRAMLLVKSFKVDVQYSIVTFATDPDTGAQTEKSSTSAAASFTIMGDSGKPDALVQSIYQANIFRQPRWSPWNGAAGMDGSLVQPYRRTESTETIGGAILDMGILLNNAPADPAFPYLFTFYVAGSVPLSLYEDHDINLGFASAGSVYGLDFGPHIGSALTFLGMSWGLIGGAGQVDDPGSSDVRQAVLESVAITEASTFD